ncbi:hypothetical protein psal_cds_867 [Pandoravirus salinus]|uniref:Uncharacterized protein n=1 Tax=Pandoravirus salinus TaxID=1349410 RepID=S4W2Z1_9VIRU|nr:hypothetical protein psal_cds_867 [Pandoravirus salinus]AGO84932.1 hypothetical protein psal_cds_867 [Pandoravirus salinus]
MIGAVHAAASFVRGARHGAVAGAKGTHPSPPPGAFRKALLAAIDRALCARDLVDRDVDEQEAVSAALHAIDAYLATPEAHALCPVVACVSARNYETLARDAVRAHRRRAMSTRPPQNMNDDDADEAH